MSYKANVDISVGIKEPTYKSKDITNKSIDILNNDYWTGLSHDNHLIARNQINLYNKTYRYGIMNPGNSISAGREFLFFTKPDLHIMEMDETGTLTGNSNPDLNDYSFWTEIINNRKETIAMLQDTYGMNYKAIYKGDRFNHLLQNSCISNLDVPQLQSEIIESPTNMYGVSITYRGSSEASDDGPEFSLEFKDTKWLDVYWFFRSYEEYETMKHHGIITPCEYYITNKIIHDSFSIYKFIVDEDLETIIYFGKMYGVYPKSLPRDVFTSPTFDNGLSYSIDFKAAFYEDMRTEILYDFNKLSQTYYNQQLYDIPIYDTNMGRTDGRPATAAFIDIDTESKIAKMSTSGTVYKLKWKGRDNV